MAVVPEIANEAPNSSSATVSEPFSSASCVPIGSAVRGLAATADALLARSGSEMALTARSAVRLAIRALWCCENRIYS
jgi:hypothetical protein